MSLFIQVYLISLLLWAYPCVDRECDHKMFINAEDDTAEGPIINCMNHNVSEGESIALMCAPSEPPNMSVIFILRGPERDCDNCTLHNGSSCWEVQGNVSSCQLTVFNGQGSDSGDYRNFTCKCTDVEDIPQQVNIFEVTTIVLLLVLVILVVLLFTFAWKLYRKTNENTSDPPEPPSPVHHDSEATPLLPNSRNRDYEAALSLPSPNRSIVEEGRDQPGGVSTTADTTFISSDSYPQRPDPPHEPVESSTSSDDASSA